jgi:hypothetical protein
MTPAAACLLALATIAEAGVASAADRPMHYARAITREDLVERTLRELELMRSIALYYAGVKVPVVKGWLHYYLPTYLPGGGRDVLRGESPTKVSPSVERQNAAFIASYEKGLPASEQAQRLEAILAKHRYAGSPRGHDFAFRAFSADGHAALLTNGSTAMLVEVPTGRPITEWKTGKGTSPPEAAQIAFFDRSGSDPPSKFPEKGSDARPLAELTQDGRWERLITPSPDGRWLVAGPADETEPETGESAEMDSHVVVVDRRSGDEILRVEADCYRLLPDSRHLVATEGKVAKAWDLSSGKPIWCVPLPPGPTYAGAPVCVALEAAPNGKLLFLNSAILAADTGRS